MSKLVIISILVLFIGAVDVMTASADRDIRVYGRIVYERDDGTEIPADNVKVKVYDEDCWGQCWNQLKVTRTDHEGRFDTTFQWGDPTLDGDPDIYVEWQTENWAVEVQSDIWQINFKRRSVTKSNVGGTSASFGKLSMAKGLGDRKPFHVHTTLTRTWRWLHENMNYSPRKIEVELYNIVMDPHYNNFTDTIHLTRYAAWREGTIMHEYGHFWVDMYSYFDPGTGLPGFACAYNSEWAGIGHSAWCEENGCAAWQEGFPTWFSDVIGRSLLGDYGIEPQYYYGYAYDPSEGPDGYEELDVCGFDSWTSHDHSPRRVEGFVAALLRDIEDINTGTDDHYPADVFADALELGHDEIFRVVDEGWLGDQEWSGGIIGSPLNGVNDFIREFNEKYPEHINDFWETAINVNIDFDEELPSNPQIEAAYHSISGESANPRILFFIGNADDDASGIDGYSVSASKDSPSIPPQDTNTNYVMFSGGSNDQYTTDPLTPGIYYFSARSRDRSGKWAAGYSTWGPTTIVEPGWYSHMSWQRNAGGSWVDYDGDGDLDFFSRIGGSGQIYRNDSSGAFTPVSLSGIDAAGTVVAVWGDMDNDGDADVYLAKRNGNPNKLYRNSGNGTFSDITGVLGENGHSSDAAWGDYDHDGYIDLFVANKDTPSKLFHNNGDGTFTDVTETRCLSRITQSGKGVAWVDYDNDGDLDLNVVNVGSNEIYKNDGSGVFTLALSWPLRDPSTGCCPDRSVAWGDFDNDGFMDFYLTIAPMGDGQDSLYRNNGDGTFSVVTQSSFEQFSASSFGAAWVDYDNDGHLDLYLMGVQHTDRPFHNGELYRNNGNLTFNDVTDLAWPLGVDYGQTWADFDGDGDLDLARRDDLLRNDVENNNHWLKVDLKGTCSNLSGTGARVWIVTGGVSQIREMTDSGSGSSIHPSQESLTVEFGLGTYSVVDSMEIVWPSGRVQNVLDVPVDQRLTIEEPPPENDCDYDGDLDDDGVQDESDFCLDTPEGETVDDRGCSRAEGGDIGDGILRVDTGDVFQLGGTSICGDSVSPAIEMDFDKDGMNDTMLAVFRISGWSHIGYWISSNYPWTVDYYLELQPQYMSDDGYSRVKIRFVDMLAAGFKINDPTTWSYKSVVALKLNASTGGYPMPGTLDVYNIYAFRNVNQQNRVDPLYGSVTGGSQKVFSDPDGIREVSIRTSWTESQINKFIIMATQPNTAEGTNVTATLDNGSVTFSEVAVPGNTFIVEKNTGEPVPDGMAACVPWPVPPYYYVETNADTSSPDIVCIRYPDTCNETQLEILTYQTICGLRGCSSSWNNVTESINTSSNIICADGGRYGPYVIVHPVTDIDGDGYTTGGTAADDCDDNDRNVYPGASEVCNGKDNDCDGIIDNGLSIDFDRDGHFTYGSCAAPADDCDDDNRHKYPGAPESCDGMDNDCDGQIDDGLSTDSDGDGHYTPDSCASPADDCNDGNPAVWGCNTPVSQSEIVINDAGSGVKITFPSVSSRGHTSAVPVSCNMSASAGFSLIPFDDPLCYDIQSTAAYGSPFEVCLPYDDTGLQDFESSMRMMKCDASGTNCSYLTTVYHNTFRNVICAEANEFSIFVMAVDRIDSDNDGVADSVDNCVLVENTFQEDFDGDNIGDVCDEDIDNDGIGNEADQCPESAPGSTVDETGCADSLSDNDNDGYTNQEERNASSNPDNPNSIPGASVLSLAKGFNLASIPADLMYFRRLFNFMEVNGGNDVFSRILVYDPEEQVFIEGGYDETEQLTGRNSEFQPVKDFSGMIIYVKKNTEIPFTSKYCRTWNLKKGVNLVGTACAPSDQTAFKLLEKMGGEANVSGIQRYDTETGRFVTAGYQNDRLAGADFPIKAGEGYLVYMKRDLSEVDPNRIGDCVKHTYYKDDDKDGFGDPDKSIQACDMPAGYVADKTDCDDGSSAINPDAPEYCIDGLDEDCDGYIDDADIQCTEDEAPSFSGLGSATLDCSASPKEIDLIWPAATDNMTQQHYIRYVVCWDDEPLTYSGGADCVVIRGETEFSVSSHFSNNLAEDQLYYLGVTAYDIAANGAFNDVVKQVLVNCVP